MSARHCRLLTGSLFPLRYTFTPRVEAATSKALLDNRPTISLSKVSILNFDKSGEKLILVKSSPVWSLILGSDALDMLLPQTCKLLLLLLLLLVVVVVAAAVVAAAEKVVIVTVAVF